MENKQTARQGDMRKAILDAAMRQFGAQGYEGASLQAIADEVGIAKPSLLYHFDSKNRLRKAVLESLLDHWKNELPGLLSNADSEHDRFTSTITALVSYFMEDESRARFALREALDRPAEIRGLIKKHLTPWIALVTDYIRLGQRLGVVKQNVNPEGYIIQVMTMAIGTVALGHVSAALFGRDRALSKEDIIGEMVRVGREALFVNPMAPNKDR